MPNDRRDPRPYERAQAIQREFAELIPLVLLKIARKKALAAKRKAVLATGLPIRPIPLQ